VFGFLSRAHATCYPPGRPLGTDGAYTKLGSQIRVGSQSLPALLPSNPSFESTERGAALAKAGASAVPNALQRCCRTVALR
jgi:hypothetical protein